MRKFLSSKKGAVALALLLLVAVSGYFYNQRQETQVLTSDFGYRTPMVVPQPQPLEVVVEEEETKIVLYEVRVRLEDLNLYSKFPSFVNDIFTKEGEESLDVKNYIFNGWDGMLRGSLVSVEPVLEFFNAGDILMIKTNDRELALTVPGDIVTFYCKVKVLENVCGGEENLNNPLSLCVEPLGFKSCDLVKVNH